jgi:sulfatase maturation enzyme AslB (radical SAM superfamily)
MLATNGMLIDRATADRLARTVALIAVSIDGPPDMHNALRGSPAAFAGAVRGIALLREAGANFAIIHTLTGASLPHLRWLVAFAREQGAGLLQLHPLELAGYAGRHMRASAVDGEVATRAWLLATLLADEHEAPKIHVDVFDRELIAAHPEMVFADDMEDAADAPLSRLVNPLVLEPNGDVVPLAYGFGRSFRVCNMRHGGLHAAVPAFRAATWPRLRALCRRAYRDVLAEDELPYFNWYERITRASCEAGALGEAATA